jgi:hypothetical protein
MAKSVEERNKEVVDEVFKLLNYMCNDKDLTKEFLDHLAREHRTLQQNFFRMLQILIENHAENSFDDRNAASVNWAKKVKDLRDENGNSFFMPFI